MRPTGSAEELERRRLRCVEAVRRGAAPAVAAQVAGVARQSVYRWLKAAKAGGRKLKAKRHFGRQPRLDESEVVELGQMIRIGPQVFGWPDELWTAARLAELVELRFGVKYHPDHLRKILHARLNMSPQKPQRQSRERDEELIRRFRAFRVPQIIRRARERGAVIIFLDEAGFMTQPTVRRTWAPRGKTPILRQQGSRHKISAISGITRTPSQGRMGLVSQLLPADTNAHDADTIDLLRAARQRFHRPLVVFWDGSNIHDKSHAVRSYLRRHPEIKTVKLPPYAPELNPDELVWGHVKYHTLSNYAPHDAEELRARLILEIAELATRADLLVAFLKHARIPPHRR